MKLDQINRSDGKAYYTYKCEVCGFSLTTDEIHSNIPCPNCSEWAEDVAEEMEGKNDRTD